MPELVYQPLLHFAAVTIGLFILRSFMRIMSLRQRALFALFAGIVSGGVTFGVLAVASA